MRDTAYGTALTARQRQVLEYIKRMVAAEGFPPTRTELATHFGWRSPNAAEEHIRALERKGAITITGGVARGIRVASTATSTATSTAPVGRSLEVEVKAWREAFPDHHFDLASRAVRPMVL